MPEYEIKVAVHRQSNRVWETTVKVEADNLSTARVLAQCQAEDKAADVDFSQFSEESVHYESETVQTRRCEPAAAAHPTARLYQIWGPDGIPISPNLYPTADIAVRAGARFVASFQRQGYYLDSSRREMSLETLALHLRVVEYPALMTAEEAYDKYLATRPDVEGYLTFNEFLGSDECIELMDPDAQDDED